MNVLALFKQVVVAVAAGQVAFMPPNASDPEPGSVIAQAPILSNVQEIGSAHSPFCADRPFRHDRARGEPDADAERG